MGPMILLKNWGSERHHKQVSIHCITLDTITDFPILVTYLITEAYELHPILIVDLFLKVAVLIRSYSFAIANGITYKEEVIKADSIKRRTSAFANPWHSKVATFIWDLGMS